MVLYDHYKTPNPPKYMWVCHPRLRIYKHARRGFCFNVSWAFRMIVLQVGRLYVEIG